MRVVPGALGLYITGHLANSEVPFLLDTGASITLLSEGTYNSLKFDKQPILEPIRFPVTQADGNPLHILGKTYIVLTFGNESRRHEVFVANIQSPAILGLDFIQSHQCKIDFSSNMFGLGHSSIPIHSEADSQVPRSFRLVTVASDTVLPAGHRCMVSLIINGDNLDTEDGIIEPLSRQSDLPFLLEYLS